jgi:hypothetical protein
VWIKKSPLVIGKILNRNQRYSSIGICNEFATVCMAIFETQLIRFALIDYTGKPVNESMPFYYMAPVDFGGISID